MALRSVLPMHEFEARGYAPGGPRGVTCRTRRATCDPGADGDAPLIFPAGIVPRVREALEWQGHVVEVVDRTVPRPRMEVDATVLGTPGRPAIRSAPGETRCPGGHDGRPLGDLNLAIRGPEGPGSGRG